MTKSIFDKVNDPPEEKSRDSGYSEFIDDFDFSNPVFFSDAASQDAVVDAPDAGFARVEPIIPESSGPIDRNVVKNLWDSFCCANPHYKEFNLDKEPFGAGSYGVTYKLIKQKNRFGAPVNELYCVKFADDIYDPDAPDAPTEATVLQAVQGMDNLAQIAVKPVRLQLNGRSYWILISRLYDGSLYDSRTTEQFNEKVIIRVGIEIANALVNLHSKGFYHRDVKPSNIFYEIQDGIRHYYLGDFGSCTQPPEPGEQTSRAAGLLAITPEYLDPKHEITRWDARIDLYALSSTMYWLLNNHQIKEHTDDFTDDNSTGVNFRLSSSRIRPTDVTNDLWRILARAMDCSDKFARIRYKSAAEFKAALEKVLEDMCAKATNNASSIEDTNEESGILPQLKGFCYLLSGKKHCKKGNYRRAYELLEKAAKNGGAAAYVPMGDLFFHGLGVPRNNVRAYDCYQKVSELADPIGRNNLGFCYATSCGMSQKNEEVAYRHFAFAANDDLPAALYNKGLCCHIGFGTDSDVPKALNLYGAACRTGIAEANTNLGVCYYTGEGLLPQNKSIALDYYNQAIKLGNAEAEYNLATHFRTTATDSSHASKAFELYKAAANKGLPIAFYALYWCYREAFGVKQDLDTANGYLNLAKLKQDIAKIEDSFENALHIKCSFIRCDQFVAKVPEFSIVDYLTSIHIYGVNTRCYLGHCFEKGICTDVDYQKALEYYGYAAIDNCPEAWARLGRFYELGLGIAQPDLKQAYHYYSFAVTAENPSGQFALGQWYEKGKSSCGIPRDPEKAFKFYKLAADNGHIEAQYHLGRCYHKGIGCKEDASLALHYFRLAGNQKHVDALNYAGALLANNGTPQEKKEGIDLFASASLIGSAQAKHNLGLCFQYGNGVEKSYLMAVELFKRAIEQNYTNSLYNIGYCYYHGGHGLEQDRIEAIHWLEKAVSYKNGNAAQLLGNSYETPPVPYAIPDYYKALCFYKLAVKLGVDAADDIARCEKEIDNLFLEDPSIDTNKFSALLNKATTPADIDSAIQWLIDSSAWRRRPRTPPPVTVPIKEPEQPRRKKTALHTGFMYYVLIAFLAVAAVYASYAGWIFPGLTHNVLGCLCRDGIILNEDPDKAFSLFYEGAEMGNARAQYNLAVCYSNEIGSGRNLVDAARQFKLSADQGFAKAQNAYGDCLDKGDGVDQDSTKAFEYYLMAAEQGNIDGQLNVAKSYLLGIGTDQDVIQAFNWTSKAAQQNHSEGLNALGAYYLAGWGTEPDSTKAFALFTKAANKGNSEAHYNLANMYHNGNGIERSIPKAIEHYSTGAELGSGLCQTSLGIIYYNGDGVDVDYDKAFELFKLAADQKHIPAYFYIGRCYEYGYGVAQDITKAIENYSAGAGLGNDNCQNSLGAIYYKGTGVDVNYDKAFELFKLAADQKHASATYNVGLCYEYGRGVEKNIVMSFEYYNNAAKLGSESAAEALTDIWGNSIDNYQSTHRVEEGFSTMKVYGVSCTVGLPNEPKVNHENDKNWIEVVRFLGDYDQAADVSNYAIALVFNNVAEEPARLKLLGSDNGTSSWKNVLVSDITIDEESGMVIFDITSSETSYEYYRVDLVSADSDKILASSSAFIFSYPVA